jgi:Peptidase family M28
MGRTYYSPGMAASPPFSERRRPRRGSLERPVNGRMYRGTWLLVGIPLLAASFTVARPQPLRPPQLPPAFDAASARQVASDFARSYPDRSPGSPEAPRAAGWVSDRLTELGFPRVETDRFEARIAGQGRVPLTNVYAARAGSSGDAIVVMAHRDNTGESPGANDNASGTAAMLEIARSFAAPAAPPSPPRPNHTIVFLSTDGGGFGALGAERFVEKSRFRDRLVAVVNLDAIAGNGRLRLEIAGDRQRSPAAALVRTASLRILDQTGAEPDHASAAAQVIDLAFPFSLYEQAPFVGHGVPALTLTTAGARPPPAFGDSSDRLDPRQLGAVGRSAQALLGSLDQEVELAQGTASYVYLGSRTIRGWALILILGAALLPCLAVIVDLFAHVRRRRIRLAPALRSYRTRLAFWLFAGAMFEVFAFVGIWEKGAARPLSPESSPGTSWPVLGLAVFTCFLAVSWLVARDRLLPRRIVSAEEELAGYTASLLVLGVLALLVVATNPFALIFVLPSLHAWIWLPQLRDRNPGLRALAIAAGFAGPALLVLSFAFRFDLGLDAPWYLAQLVAVGYVPLTSVLLLCGWLAVSAQLVALAAGRYAPYPDAAERPPLGPIRAFVRRLVLFGRRRRQQRVPMRAVGG